MNQKGGYVYIMCSPNRGVLYTGVTSDLIARIYEHRNKQYPDSFSAKYNCVVLVYYAQFATMYDTIEEEKRIKAGSRKKKEEFESVNPNWVDLWDDIQ
jgi:putative endonuclease